MSITNLSNEELMGMAGQPAGSPPAPQSSPQGGGIQGLSNDQLMQMAGGGPSDAAKLGSYGMGIGSGVLDTVKNYADTTSQALDSMPGQVLQALNPSLGPGTGIGQTLSRAGHKASGYIDQINNQISSSAADKKDFDLGRNVGYYGSQYGPAVGGIAKGIGKGVKGLAGKVMGSSDTGEMAAKEAAIKAAGIDNPSPLSVSGNKHGQALAGLLGRVPLVGSKGKYLKQNEKLANSVNDFTSTAKSKATYDWDTGGWNVDDSVSSALKAANKSGNPLNFVNKVTKDLEGTLKSEYTKGLPQESVDKLNTLVKATKAMEWQLKQFKPGMSLYDALGGLVGSGIGLAGYVSGSSPALATAATGIKSLSSFLNSPAGLKLVQSTANLSWKDPKMLSLLSSAIPGLANGQGTTAQPNPTGQAQ